ncbi:MAG: hypothetical protein SV375_16035 [Thermodesulfobacteriota bacterium]|nr:hypothetical protein [Thermodesulfobacteriota bacterium]
MTDPMGRVNDKWEKIPWDEAFDFIAGKLKKKEEEDGGHGLLCHKGPLESPVSSAELAEKYPLLLITGARSIVFTHSQHRNNRGNYVWPWNH